MQVNEIHDAFKLNGEKREGGGNYTFPNNDTSNKNGPLLVYLASFALFYRLYKTEAKGISINRKHIIFKKSYFWRAESLVEEMKSSWLLF